MKVKYEYLLKAWGGFWNTHNIDVHKEPKVDYYWFDTKEERDSEVKRLKSLEKQHGEYLKNRGKTNDSCIAMVLTEGFLTRYEFIIQTHAKVGSKIKIVENNLGYGFFSEDELDELGNNADYMKEYKYDIQGKLPTNHTRLFTTLLLR